ncbi:TonB-dependent siderophore receptor [Cyanobium sp. CH-040]|uniref:TonB-dependent siderophore receptor n=1 Tax=Cyanobium sp. CH-040 TaxID=2823708 RepID=UPI0020CF52F2|nr:TonB-dependent siderophore receptor [Cyanobium sp. CH-040]MCP9928792.1 TonB-dependent siderophore receptor [Cyanobium sp. CH-040]
MEPGRVLSGSSGVLSKTRMFRLLMAAGLLGAVAAVPVHARTDEATAQVPEDGVRAPGVAWTRKDWLAQNETARAVITGVQVSETPEGLTVELVSDRTLTAGPTRVEGNALVTDIPNAVLNLDNQDAAEQFAPAEGIALVQVTGMPDGSVRLSITGTEGPPTAQVISTAGNLVLSLRPGMAQASRDEDAIQIGVTGQGDDGYQVPDASVGSRTPTPLRNLPFSVQVVPQRLLQDRDVQGLNEALRTVVGVIPDNSSQSAFQSFTIRGFSGRDILRNGLRDDTNITTRSPIPNIERIEVLQGPAGALFGQGSPGGTVNIITKKPLATPHYIVEGTIGNFETYEGSIDFTGPIDRDGNLLYRFIAGARTSDTFIDFFDTRSYLIAPSISWQISPNTRLTVEGEYSVAESPNDRGLPAAGTVLPNVNGRLPRSRFIGEPDDKLDKNNRDNLRLGYILDHQFNSDWKFQNSFRVSFLNSPQNSLFPTNLLDDQRTLERGLFSTSDQSQDNWAIDTNVVGRFKTGSVGHRVLLGLDYNRDFYSASSREFTLDPIDIFDPVYGQTRRRLVESFPKDTFLTENIGVYLQDQIDLLPQLKLLIGGRVDWARQRFEFGDGSNESQEDVAFSPRLGVVYQPSDVHAFYASYSRSFLQNVGSTFDDSTFEPERGTQYEVGVKSDWIKGRLSTTLALYEITRSNVLTEDPLNPNFSVQTGEQRSRGVELTATGTILPGWNIVAGYAYTDAEVSDDNTIRVGNQLNNVPENAASLWTTYEIQEGSLQGLGFGLGLFYVGERQGDLENSFQLPGYTRTDISLFYKREQFRIGLNIENIFDTRYFESSQSDLRVSYGAPLTVRATVSWKF